MGLIAAKNFIQHHERFVLAAHSSPDGDTLGSCLALRLCLLSMGKNVSVVCEDAVPEYLRFLPGAETITSDPDPKAEAVLYIDCAEHSRTGKNRDFFENAPFQFCIDHHETNPCATKDGDWVEDVGACAELIYRLIVEIGVPVTKEIAECLFTGVATDTGNFSYTNTTPDTFRIAAELLSAGIDISELNRKLFRTISLGKARLISMALGAAEIFLDGTASLSCVSSQDMKDAGAKEAECEGLIDYLRDIDSVEIACLLRESSDGTIKGSLRSKHEVNVLTVAKRFGGGGHRKAAGFTFLGSLDEAHDAVIPAIKESVQEWKESFQS